MKIFVTGATGFVGSHLVKKLKKYDVYGLVRWTGKKRDFPDFVPVYGNLTDHTSINRIIKELKPEVVVNLGAITPVSLSFERPMEYQEVNYLAAVNLAEANLKYNPYLEKFVHASTPEVYGIQESFPIKEDAKLNPNSPYAVSKAAFDLYLQYLYRAYEFPVVISRHANTYGRKEQTHFVIESIVTQMIKGNKVRLGAKEPVRDFLYIDDTVEFYRKLIHYGEPGEIYNAGWGVGYSIGEVVKIAKRVTKWKGRVFWNAVPRRPGEIPKLVLDVEKAKHALDWRPSVPLELGIWKVYEFWRKRL